MVIRVGDKFKKCDPCPFISQCPYYEFSDLESCGVIQVEGDTSVVVKIVLEEDLAKLVNFAVPAEHKLSERG